MPADPRTGVVLPTGMGTLGEVLEGFLDGMKEAGKITHLALVAHLIDSAGAPGTWRYRIIGPVDANVAELVAFLRAAAETLTKRADALEQAPPVTVQ